MAASLMERLLLHAQRRRISRQFLASNGYAGDFENPRTAQEKIQYRKLYGNHEFYAYVADKYRVREYVATKAGAQHLIPLLGVYDRLQPSDFDRLPARFIIKANHGCKWHRVVRDKSQLDVAATARYFNRMRWRRYGWIACERHYNFIPPKTVIEELLEDDYGGLPWDYSFFCYHGPSGFDFNYGVVSPEGLAATFAKDGSLYYGDLSAAELERRRRPANFDAMLKVAETLSADFDFVRVDLYSVQGKVYFGELTLTPHQGYGLITLAPLQKMRDEMWQLAADNPRLYRGPQYYGIRTGAPQRAVALAIR